MNSVVRIRDWACPGNDPYYTPRLSEGDLDQASIRAALDAVAERGKGTRLAIDAGAHIGTWSRPLAKVFDRVIAFEPHPALACLYRANMEAGRNVRLIEAAVWDRCGVMGLKHGEINSGQAFLTGLADPDLLTMVPCVAIDDMRLEGLDLLKLDVEGAELYALKGALSTLERERPVVVIEQNSASQRFKLPWYAAAEWLQRLGMYEVARVEFASGEFNVVFVWKEQ
jgi:FkbM family methyltransferase